MKKISLSFWLFLATATAPGIAAGACVIQAIDFGQTVNGSLTTDDCSAQYNGHNVYFDQFEFSGVAGQRVAISYTSTAFDTLLQLVYPDATFVDDDDSGGGTNSRIPANGFLTLSQTGTYTILPFSFASSATGAYTLTLDLASTAPAVVEYFNPDLNNYFITADPGEQSYVDSGAVGRWQRTGNAFGANGPNQVCRFYGSPLGPNSHFYTADAGECAYLKSIYNPAAKNWKFESNDFSTTAAVNNACASGLVPVYRAYNNGFARGIDSNHRITSNLTAYQQTEAAGWSGEGIVMCAPPGGTSSNCTYVFSPIIGSVPASGGNVSVSVSVGATAGCQWSATSNASWITITSGASGSGNGTVSFSASANTGAVRGTNLTIAGQLYPVVQLAAAPACTISLSASSTSVGAIGGSGAVGVVAPTGCAWSATSNAGWVTIASGASGSGNGTVGYLASTNTSTAARTGTITIAGSTFTINQSGGVPASGIFPFTWMGLVASSPRFVTSPFIPGACDMYLTFTNTTAQRLGFVMAFLGPVQGVYVNVAVFTSQNLPAQDGVRALNPGTSAELRQAATVCSTEGMLFNEGLTTVLAFP